MYIEFLKLLEKQEHMFLEEAMNYFGSAKQAEQPIVLDKIDYLTKTMKDEQTLYALATLISKGYIGTNYPWENETNLGQRKTLALSKSLRKMWITKATEENQELNSFYVYLKHRGLEYIHRNDIRKSKNRLFYLIIISVLFSLSVLMFLVSFIRA